MVRLSCPRDRPSKPEVVLKGCANHISYVPLGLGQSGEQSSGLAHGEWLTTSGDSGLINIDLPLNLLGSGNGPLGSGTGNGQSAIWSLGRGHELLAHYANPDGSE